MGCHSPHPTNPAFAAPPLGVMLDSYDHARMFAPRIRGVAVDAQIMPLGNTTGMTPGGTRRNRGVDRARNQAMNSLSTHVLDTAHGKPAMGVTLILTAADGAVLFSGQTNGDGRCPGLPALSAGRYRLSFAVADYFRTLGVALADPPFLDVIAIDFGVAADGGHYHVPLLVAPFELFDLSGQLIWPCARIAARSSRWAADPLRHDDAVDYQADGLLVIEDGLVVARGDFADLAGRFADLPIATLPGLIVPGFVDAHVHYPQMDRIASHGEQLLDWLDRHIFPAEMAFADRAVADRVAAAFLDELLRNGTTSALVYPTVHPQSVDALFAAAAARDMRIITGKVLMDLGPDGLADTVASGRAETEALIRRWAGHGRLGYAITPRFALACSDAQMQAAGELLAAHPEVLLHTHLAENRHECAAVAQRFPEAADYLDVYAGFGLVGARSVFAHGVHLSDDACARLAMAGAGIAVCPSSNLFLGSGFFHFGQADAQGVRLGLGTDIGAGTSFSLMHTAGLAYQAALAREEKLDPFRALYLATAGSADLLHIGDRGGRARGRAGGGFHRARCAGDTAAGAPHRWDHAGRALVRDADPGRRPLGAAHLHPGRMRVGA